MSYRQAILIQNIFEYIQYLRPYLYQELQSYIYTGITEEEALQWIIAEELELNFSLFTKHHPHNQQPYAEIHNRLQVTMPIALSKLTTHYIEAPKLYGDNVAVTLTIRGGDLYLFYEMHSFQSLY